MIFIATDILNPYKREILSEDSYKTLIKFLIDKYPSGFEKPTDISVNGVEIAVDDYDIALNENDVIVLLDRTALPVGLIGGWFITALANLAISVTLSYVANRLFAPDEPSTQAQPSSVYALNSAQNMSRYGSPIPIVYGKVRMYPSMIVQPYYKYEDNIEYLYHIMCVSQGTCTTDNVFIGDDLITSTGDFEWKLLYQDSFYNIPLNGLGVHVTKTLSNPSNMKLEKSTETEKYEISASAKYVEFDYNFPAGLYHTTAEGDYSGIYQDIYYTIYTYNGTSYTQVATERILIFGNNADPIQKTKTIDISAYDTALYISFTMGYYYDKPSNTNTLYVKRVKELYENEDFTNLYGDITLLACKIKATDAISAAGQVKVNGYFERTDVGNTMHEVLTDIYTNTSYGGGLSADDLSFPVTTETVNCCYDENITIFDAMRKPALAQGYSLYLAGMDVILKKDGVNTITSGMYNEMNILRNSFKTQYLFKEEFPTYDGYEVTYIDGCGWIPRTEKYPDTSTRPQVVDLFGVVDYSCVPIVYHRFDMTITASQDIVFVAVGGSLTHEDNGDGTYRIWSEDALTHVYIDTTVSLQYDKITGAVVHSMEGITSAFNMFLNCTNMTTCVMSASNSTSLTNINAIFKGCQNLTDIDMTGLDTSNVTDFKNMFYGLYNITHITLSNLSFASATDMSYMFHNCHALICITNLDTSNSSNNTGIFGTMNLVSPDAATVALLESVPGISWVNPSACP